MKQQQFVQKNNKTDRNNSKSIAILFWVAVLFSSCSNNNVSKITSFSHPPGSPNIVSDSIEVYRSDSAIIQNKLVAPKLLIFDNIDEPYTEFPEGFHFTQYTANHEISSSISASYGKHFDKKNLWEARQNVIAVTEAGDTLKTELLYYDEDKGIIYSDQFVKFIQNERIITGTGFKSDIQMKNWYIKKIKGEFDVEVEE